ncbi:hypothetical protein RND81_02G076500 [Saponaria officinalis]|uniref:Uncharacterized protein n=1 Tax=Saponaria officinalis TaxID=3572 RepID=A0AAW1MS48_SAPOF
MTTVDMKMEKSKSYTQYNKFETIFEDEITGKSSTNKNKSYSFNGGQCSNNRGATLGTLSSYDNAEGKRKKRVASYNMFSVERKFKSSVKSSFRWFKSKFSDVNGGCPN